MCICSVDDGDDVRMMRIWIISMENLMLRSQRDQRALLKSPRTDHCGGLWRITDAVKIVNDDVYSLTIMS